MKKAIIVSGTPGTGKTTIAKKISKEKDYRYLDINDVIKENKLKEGFDKKRKSIIVDVKKLNKILVNLIKNSKKTLVIDGHLSHYLPKEYVKVCFITKCDLKTLKKRLEKRGYNKAKVRENLDAEIFDVCRIEALENGYNVKVVDTTKNY
ncbi:adenylate kinase family protein [Candidatus Woesearchaeota archaeon]|nr:adenylate kinase family protein [Candidatus Woesearchaeota archaeon]